MRELVTEFDCHVREHPEFAEGIPDNALVAMLLERGDEEFNQWSQEGCQMASRKGTADWACEDQEDPA